MYVKIYIYLPFFMLSYVAAQICRIYFEQKLLVFHFVKINLYIRILKSEMDITCLIIHTRT
jgi:hypothetical protein